MARTQSRFFAFLAGICLLGASLTGVTEEAKTEETRAINVDFIIDQFNKGGMARKLLYAKLVIERRQLAQAMTAILLNDNNATELKSENAQKVVAAQILGEIKAEETMNVLFKNIKYRLEVFDNDSMAVHFPFWHALVRIGKPASKWVVEEIPRMDADEKTLWLWILLLNNVEGNDVAKFMLKNKLAKTKDKIEIKRINAALDELKKIAKIGGENGNPSKNKQAKEGTGEKKPDQ